MSNEKSLEELSYEEILNKLLDSARERDKSRPLKYQRYMSEAVDSELKGIIHVWITCLLEKIKSPLQDIRYHQSGMLNSNGESVGFSGRGNDTKFVAPFLKHNGFPSASESGWLTRSLEQPYPYTLDYQGKIQKGKQNFLDIINLVQCESQPAAEVLTELFVLLDERRVKKDSLKADKLTPNERRLITIDMIVSSILSHIESNKISGTSQIPVLAIRAIYECIVNEVAMYKQKTLKPLARHNSSDANGDSLGDIEVIDESGEPFEVVEVKFRIPVNYELIKTACDKINKSSLKRYYWLTTSECVPSESVVKLVTETKKKHGCEIVINGVVTTLKYYLRLIKDPTTFIDKYTDLILTDSDLLKFEHKTSWVTEYKKFKAE